ncbi:MAG: long-chain fatty acid--CoA ligase [Spirochaeta sp.]|jgi:long-chain acyl-CoA synthetase|nr:long-chain fatty acid--CoA ligase [Spirochaeta sp.]
MSMTIPQLVQNIAHQYPDNTAQLVKDDAGVFHPRSWQELRITVDRFAAGLQTIGATRGGHIGLISENRAEWFVADLATMTIGAVDVPRGNDATNGELQFILSVTEAAIIIVENDTQLQKVRALAKDLPAMRYLIQLDDSYTPSTEVPKSVTIMNYSEVLTAGARAMEEDPERIERERDQGNEHDVATIIFTSGTTGEPKGVMLTHRNFLHQVENVPQLIDVGPENIWLCVLPVWHSFERIMQYVAMGRGSALAYSKPIGKIMLEDFQKVRPTWMASVPRIWEAIRAGIYRNIKKQSAVSQALFAFFVRVGGSWASLRDMFTGRLPRFHKRVRILDSALAAVPLLLLTPFKLLGDALVFRKIQARLGGRFKAGISGGGALPQHVDRFFSAAGILLLEGYGLTETAPVLGVRAQNHPVPGTVGPVFPGTEIRIVGEDGTVLGPGEQGVVHARGPQIMTGYYKRPDLTEQIISSNGWLDTGDLGMLTWDNELKITGRAKDTVVLLGGENIEPAPIEERLRASEFIAQAVVLGQDQKFLGALIVPDFEALDAWTETERVTAASREELVEDPKVRSMYNQVISGIVNAQNGFKSFEQIYRFQILPTDFTVGEELSAKQEIKRHVIDARYKTQIAQLFT